MKTYTKHHYPKWHTDQEGLGALGKMLVKEDEAHSKCSRCGLMVKMGRVGGMKFWVGGKWVSKRPPCQVPEG